MNPSGKIICLPMSTNSYNQNEVVPSKISSKKQPYDEFHFRRRYISVLQKVANEWSKTKLASDNKYIKIQFSEPRFNLKNMNELYSNERINYFTKEGLEEKQIYVINGLIYNTDLNFYNSTTELNAEDGEGEMIVMDRLGNMFIAPKERGIFHHSSFFSGKPVAFAALCFIKEGKIQNLVRYSGHYNPGEDEEDSFAQQIKTNYLVEEMAFNALKIDSKGSLVQTISISSKQKVSELYDTISEIGEFSRPRLRLISEGKGVPTAKVIDNALVEITIAETSLKNGCTIHALEITHTPLDRIFPVSKFELIIRD